MKEIKFKDGFLWGGAVSAEQTEGHGTSKKAKTVYDEQFEKYPEMFWDGVGPSVTSDFMNNYKEDIKSWKEHGINSHRTSFSWARLFPEGDYTKPNQEAVQWYHDFLDELIKNDIKPLITLYHFDMPMYAFDKGGFESREVWNDFLEYSKFVFHEFSDKVKIWTTMNEPWVPVHMGYIEKYNLPLVNDPQRAVNAAYGIIMSHAYVVNYFNESVKDKYGAEIGAIFNCQYTYPKDANNPEDVKAAHYYNLFQFIGMTDPMVAGKLNEDSIEWVKEMGLVPENYEKGDKGVLAKVDVQLIGLNFYSPARAEAPDKSETPRNKFQEYFKPYNMPGRRENKFRGWEIYPEAVYDTMMELYTRYGKDKKYMLTEYGMGVEKEFRFRNKDGFIQDDYRISFMKEHLEHLHRFASDTGANVIGAHCWATFDCWSWANAYKNTYGLFEVDIKTQKRTPKASAKFMKELSKTNSFDKDYKKMEEYMDFEKVGYTTK